MPADTTNYKSVTRSLTVKVNASSSSGSGGTTNTNQQVADSAKALISALPTTIDVSDKEKISSARSAFDALTDYQKSLIPDAVKKKLTDAETALIEAEKKVLDKETADKVKQLIDALPATITTATEELIEATRKAYGALSDDQKALISKTKLEEAEEKLKKAMNDKTVAEQVKVLIDALPSEVSSQMKEQILSAVTAYNKLTDDQKKLIDEAVKKKLEDITVALDEALKQEEIDTVAANTVTSMIKLLPEVDKASENEKSAIETVKDIFDNLTSEQQKLISDEQVEKLNALIIKIGNIEKSEQFSSVVDSIKGSKAGEGKAKLDMATKILAMLTDEQKKFITSEVMDSYNSAVSAFKTGTVFKSGDAYYKILPSGNVSYNKPANKESMTSCTIPNQVKKRGYLYKVVKISIGALNGFGNLRWVIVHKNIESIGKYAFKNTPKLKRIKIMSKKLTDGRVVRAFAGAGKKKGAELTVKTPKDYEGKYEALFKSEGKLNEKAAVRVA